MFLRRPALLIGPRRQCLRYHFCARRETLEISKTMGSNTDEVADLNKKTFLQTARVRLVEINRQDIPLLMDLDSDPEVMKYLTGGRPSTLEEVTAGMERILKVMEKFQSRFGFWFP